MRPQAVVRCRNAADVAETLGFARRFGIPVAPRSGGHCFAGRSSTEGIVIDVSPMRAVSVSDGVATSPGYGRPGAVLRIGNANNAAISAAVTAPAAPAKSWWR